ncbi:MAG: hypothetical protein VX677_11725 [Candidatus Poribacteria bacterium]|nr:hypothetical protein [Candidatus Poribacteria bacterium]
MKVSEVSFDINKFGSDDLRVVVGKSCDHGYIIHDAAEASGVTPRLLSKCLRVWSHARCSLSQTISLRKSYGGNRRRNCVLAVRTRKNRLLCGLG